VKIFDTTDFGYRKITVERPLRLNFAITPERIARLRSERAFVNLATTPEGDTPPAACLCGLCELTSKRPEQVAPTLVLGSEPERDEVHGRFL
jgi:hypothetical protein